MRKKLFRLVSLWLLLLFMAGQSVLAAVPGINAPITKNNILSLLDVYDKDGAYLLRTMAANGNYILSWWQDSDQIVDRIDTGVHEEFHRYSFTNMPENSEKIYIGGQKYIRVNLTRVFPSKRMSTTIPGKLRTMRWDTYVGRPTANLASDVWGIYGLLNEFTAYYWGMHAQMALYDYLKASQVTPDFWQQFINLCANDRLAYAEFKYYMMQYLAYARENERSVYNGIIGNQSFLEAYRTIEKKFSALITKFEKRMREIETLLESQGYDVEIGEYYYIDQYGVGIFQKDYDNLTKELKKPAYKNLLKGSASASSGQKPGKTSITSLKKSKKGAAVKWKKASRATGYYVYRKAAGEKKYKKVGTVSGTSWTDRSVKKGKKYSYKIIPFAKEGVRVTKGKASAVKTLLV